MEKDWKKQGDAFWTWFTKAYAVPQRCQPKPNWEWDLALRMEWRDDDDELV